MCGILLMLHVKMSQLLYKLMLCVVNCSICTKNYKSSICISTLSWLHNAHIKLLIKWQWTPKLQLIVSVLKCQMMIHGD